MITLEKQFVSGVGGFSSAPLTYTQVTRTDKAAVYLRSRDNKPMEYEVFRIFVKPKGAKVFQKVYEDDTEEYPSTGKFGFSAWSVVTLGRAMEKFKELCAKADDIKDDSIDEEEDNIIKPTNVEGEYSIAEYASTNNLTYPNAYVEIQSKVAKGSIRFVRKERRNLRGKPTSLYCYINNVSTMNVSNEKEIEKNKPKVVTELPSNEFTIAIFAEKNKLPYTQAYLAVKEGLAKGTIKFLRKEKIGTGKGKKSSIYSNI